MPTYEYECENCEKNFDLFQSMTAEHIKVCPVCNGKVTRLIGSGGGIIFKGSGFYQTDYKNTKKEDTKKENPCPLSKDKPACEGCSAKE